MEGVKLRCRTPRKGRMGGLGEGLEMHFLCYWVANCAAAVAAATLHLLKTYTRK